MSYIVCHQQVFPAYSYKHSSLVHKLKNTDVKSFVTLATGAYARVDHLKGVSLG
jgi:hypothetical protein